MPDASFTFLGTSAGLPSPNRACSGHILRVGESLNLIDCGGGVSSSFLRCGFDPLKVDRIFISHSHPDHVCELPLFIQMIYLTGRAQAVELYIPAEFVEPFEILMESMYLFRTRMPFELRTLGYKDGFSFEGPFSLRAIGNTHLRKYAQVIEQQELPNKMQCHSFDIRVGESTLLYSSDIGAYADIELHIESHDFVILEAAHLDIIDLLKHVATAQVGRFIITHVVSEESVNEIVTAVRGAGLTNLIVAYDGFAVNLCKK
jgi:hypothetical protein